MMNTSLLNELLMADDLKVVDIFVNALPVGYDKVITDNINYWFFIPKDGKPDVCLVSHVDTVRKDKRPIALIQNRNILTNANGVLGGDDRAGIFIIANVVNNLDRLPAILLTNFEETGGIGVSKAVKDKILDGFDWKMFIEWDRRGINEVVSYVDFTSEFEDYIASFGYSWEWGSYSDVATISRYNNVSHVNLSACFDYEHTASEYINLAGLPMAIEMGTALVEDVQCSKKYWIVPVPKVKAVAKKGKNVFGQKGWSASNTLDNDIYYQSWYQKYLSSSDDEFTKKAKVTCPVCGNTEHYLSNDGSGYIDCEWCESVIDESGRLVIKPEWMK